MHIRITWATFKKSQSLAPTSGDLIGLGGALVRVSLYNSPCGSNVISETSQHSCSCDVSEMSLRKIFGVIL